MEIGSVLLGLLAQSIALMAGAEQVLSLVAAIVAAVFAGRLGWHLTDRVLAWRGSAD